MVGTKSDVSQNTLDQYKRNLATAAGFFGKKQLDKIQAHDLETMLKAIREEGRSSTSARQVFTNVTGPPQSSVQARLDGQRHKPTS
jgi:site-specific recombinase XerD